MMDGALIGTWVAAALTLMVLSYVLSDNPLYKLAEHIFVGASIGWTFVLIYRNVLLGNLFYKLKDAPEHNLPLLIPLLMGLLILFRPVRQVAWLGNIPLAFVIGAGAALTIVGAAAGLLVPQVAATILPVVPATTDWTSGVSFSDPSWGQSLNNLLIVVGVVSTLLYFHFTGKQLGILGRPLGWVGGLGKYMMMIAFGALFASIAISRLSLLVGRISFLLDVVR